MSDLKSAAELALEALKQIDAAMPFPVAKLAIKKVEEALAKQDQDWSLLEATQQSLREHMAMLKELQAKQEQCKYPNCDYPCMNLPDCQKTEDLYDLAVKADNGGQP